MTEQVDQEKDTKYDAMESPTRGEQGNMTKLAKYIKEAELSKFS